MFDFVGSADVCRELNRRKFFCDHRPGAGIRIAPHFYTKPEEIDLFFAELKKIRGGAATITTTIASTIGQPPDGAPGALHAARVEARVGRCVTADAGVGWRHLGRSTPLPDSSTSSGAPGSCGDVMRSVSVTVPTRVGWNPTLNATVSFGCSIVGKFGLSIENGVRIIGGSSCERRRVAVLDHDALAVVAEQVHGDLAEVERGRCDRAAAVDELRADVGRRARLVGDIGVPDQRVVERCTTFCRCGVTATVAVAPVDSELGYTDGRRDRQLERRSARLRASAA